MLLCNSCKIVPHISLVSPYLYPDQALHFCPSGDIPANAGPVTAGFCQILPSAFPPWSPDGDHPHRAGGLLGNMATYMLSSARIASANALVA